ncbi:hypothetical protein CCE28_10920 [Anaeromicrobium sediminis]|uniref:Uncharacterized protein n=2 Tax=Anaeromicrobium sediminis TaxID=1478221 RepID=A0A267MKN6_9FIRM|nr:hypothetical protein CCE28_10920 [Anaeromicrobium sediminis]
MLELNKRNELMKFIDLVKPYVNQIPCMKYKVDVKNRLKYTPNKLSSTTNKRIITCPLNIIDNHYSKEDINTIIKIKNKHITNKKIAHILQRPYWGLVDKVRRLKKEGKL